MKEREYEKEGGKGGGGGGGKQKQVCPPDVNHTFPLTPSLTRSSKMMKRSTTVDQDNPINRNSRVLKFVCFDRQLTLGAEQINFLLVSLLHVLKLR
jgi:hypothetical protein